MIEKKVAKLVIETIVNNKGLKKGLEETEKEVEKSDKKLSNRKGIDFDKALGKAMSLGKGLTKVLSGVAKGFYEITGTAGLLGGLFGSLGALGVIIDKAFEKAFGSSEQFKANLKYIGFVGSKMIENFLNPAIEKTSSIIEQIVNGLVKLLQYLGLILSTITGRNIFAGTGIEDYQKAMDDADKKAKSTSKSIKQIKKDLMGFDEINKLSADSGGTTSGGVSPNLNFGALEIGDAPGWLQWILENGQLVRDLLLAIAGGVVAIKLGADGLQALGISMMIMGILGLLRDVKELIEDPTWEHFGDVVTNLGLIVGGFGLAIASLPVILAGAILIMDGLIIKFSNEIVAKIQFIRDVFNQKLDELANKSNWFVTWLAQIISLPFRQLMSQLEGLLTGAKQVFDGILLIANGNLKEGLKNVFAGIGNMFVGMINGVIDGINTILSPLRTLIKEASKIAGKNWSMSDISIPHVPTIKLAKGGILNNPGQGVNMGNVIGGEQGRELYLPLNDQTLDSLGLAIARHMEINATLINQMNGRTISRELKRVANDTEFASNM